MDLKQFALEARMYCLDHGDKYPEDLGVLVTASSYPKFFEGFDVKRFEFVGPSRDEGELFRRGPEKTVTIREKDFDAEKTAGEPRDIGVIEHYGKNRKRAQTIQRGQVTEARCRGVDRRSRAGTRQ